MTEGWRGLGVGAGEGDEVFEEDVALVVPLVAF